VQSYRNDRSGAVIHGWPPVAPAGPSDFLVPEEDAIVPNDRTQQNDRSHRVNEQIRIPTVRLFDDTTGESLGIVPIESARQLAQERELDLVEVAPLAQPPVCRLMDYGRYKFEQLKKDKESRRYHRRASPGIVIPSGTIGLSASARSTLALRFSVTKYVFRQSPSGHRLSFVSVPVSVSSSNGRIVNRLHAP